MISGIFDIIKIIKALFALYDDYKRYKESQRIIMEEKRRQDMEKALDDNSKAKTPEEAFHAQEDIVTNSN